MNISIGKLSLIKNLTWLILDLAPKNASHGNLQVGVHHIHEDGRLTTELEHQRRHVFCCHGGDDAAGGVAAGVEDVFEVELEQAGGLRHCTVHDGDGVGIEVLGDEISHQLRAGRAELGGLQDHGAACGDGTGQRQQGDDGRVIPQTCGREGSVPSCLNLNFYCGELTKYSIHDEALGRLIIVVSQPTRHSSTWGFSGLVRSSSALAILKQVVMMGLISGRISSSLWLPRSECSVARRVSPFSWVIRGPLHCDV